MIYFFIKSCCGDTLGPVETIVWTKKRRTFMTCNTLYTMQYRILYPINLFLSMETDKWLEISPNTISKFIFFCCYESYNGIPHAVFVFKNIASFLKSCCTNTLFSTSELYEFTQLPKGQMILSCCIPFTIWFIKYWIKFYLLLEYKEDASCS